MKGEEENEEEKKKKKKKKKKGMESMYGTKIVWIYDFEYGCYDAFV